MATALLESSLPDDLVDRISRDVHKLRMAGILDDLIRKKFDVEYMYGKLLTKFPNIHVLKPGQCFRALTYLQILNGARRILFYDHKFIYVTIQELAHGGWLIHTLS